MAHWEATRGLLVIQFVCLWCRLKPRHMLDYIPDPTFWGLGVVGAGGVGLIPVVLSPRTHTLWRLLCVRIQLARWCRHTCGKPAWDFRPGFGSEHAWSQSPAHLIVMNTSCCDAQGWTNLFLNLFNESLMVKFPFFLRKAPLHLSGCSLKECRCAGECTGSIFTIPCFFCPIWHLFKTVCQLLFCKFFVQMRNWTVFVKTWWSTSLYCQNPYLDFVFSFYYSNKMFPERILK